MQSQLARTHSSWPWPVGPVGKATPGLLTSNVVFVNKWEHMRGLNFQPIMCFVYIDYVGHGHFATQRSENIDILKVYGSNYA